MDLNEEKEKARFVYKLELRKILVDKALFGVILVVAGMIANILIENYRSDLTKEQFLLEKRLNAIQSIKSSYDEMSALFANLTASTDRNDAIPEKKITAFDNAIDNFALQENKWDIILPSKFYKQATFYVWLYSGSIDMVLKRWSALNENEKIMHRLFINDTRRMFYDLCRESIDVKDEPLSHISFGLEKWSLSKISQLGTDAYYKKNFEGWKSIKR